MSEVGYHEIEPVNGHKRWACDVEGCPCNTFTERVMVQHVAEVHRFKTSGTIVVTDKDGRVREE